MSKAVEHPPFGERTSISPRMLQVGFAAGIVLAFACLIFSVLYLNNFLTISNTAIDSLLKQQMSTPDSREILDLAINGRLVMARLALLSCGMFVGLGFGFVGFALFLIGVKGEIDTTAEFAGAKATFSRLAPGVLVILCASVLIGVCATRETPFEYAETTTSTQATTTTGEPSGEPNETVPKYKPLSPVGEPKP